MVEVGQIIIADKILYEVDAIWPVGSSKVIDFTAKQLTEIGKDAEGNQIYPGRGFSYSVKNWELEDKLMPNQEEIKIWNLRLETLKQAFIKIRKIETNKHSDKRHLDVFDIAQESLEMIEGFELNDLHRDERTTQAKPTAEK